MKEDLAFEKLVPLVKRRDGNRCVHCERGGNFLRVVRRNQFKPDSMQNLETVCGAHTPHWE